MKQAWVACAFVAAVCSGVTATARASETSAGFNVYETPIVELQAAQTAGKVSARGLVEAYIARIEAYDRAGPKLNSIVALNPRAIEEAEALDRERAQRGPRGPLHGIPILVKDNFDVAGMVTGGGSIALATNRASQDAFQVERLRAAGAVILGKTTMHELAAGITTESSLTGITRNPYDPTRLPGGSSGGTGAAVAASFAAAGLGTDTSGSILIPSAFQNLFGLRPTRGLASRGGVLPMSSSQDVAGPMARTVTDLAILLDATVGRDPRDPASVDSRRWVPKSYREALQPGGIKGVRIGVARSLFPTSADDKEAVDLVLAALDALKAQGATLVEVELPLSSKQLMGSETTEYEFKFDLANYFHASPAAPVESLSQILDRGLYGKSLESRLRSWNKPEVLSTPKYREVLALRAKLRNEVLETFREHRLDVLAYPGVSRQPAVIGTSQGGWGAGCQLSPATGLPQLAIPVAFSTKGLPIGMALLARDFAEPTLLTVAYGWEQSRKPRRAPSSVPPLKE
ncbi:amidase [Steroidobacter sp.]|uniref:amidase n=1 Tax=Steroidobacter sp. TaxID=1978227 RepID=UPI001A435CBF|nr:amidase family protein [Steroidobacter sp.]MBL8268560.1 hypothetical protein [Steroidobacter sp.]